VDLKAEMDRSSDEEDENDLGMQMIIEDLGNPAFIQK